MKQVQWNKTVYELFKTEAMLSDDEQYIMESRIRNVPISAQADFLGVSESSVHRMVNLLKKKYRLPTWWAVFLCDLENSALNPVDGAFLK